MAPLLHRAAIKKKKETTGQKYNGHRAAIKKLQGKNIMAPLLHRAAIRRKETTGQKYNGPYYIGRP